jgi:hypothetical protein
VKLAYSPAPQLKLSIFATNFIDFSFAIFVHNGKMGTLPKTQTKFQAKKRGKRYLTTSCQIEPTQLINYRPNKSNFIRPNLGITTLNFEIY